MAIYRTPIKNNPGKPKRGNTVYSVIFTAEPDTIHTFGSISAIFDKFTSDTLCVSKSRLWSFGITPERPYRNKSCTIHKGEIHRKKGNRKNPD